jgi:four helix bundle protein
MSAIESYRDLKVWQKAMDQAVACYRTTTKLPSDERFGLIAQIRRAAASVPANIAEGYGRESAGSYAQLLRVAQGSLKELETHIELCCRVGFIDSDTLAAHRQAADEIGRMLRSLIRAVEKAS